MIIKPMDDKTQDIRALEQLLLHPQASFDQKNMIEQELRKMRSGAKGERDAAYELDFQYGKSGNWVILHDLRIEHEGRVAQIDHLAINRLLEFWVCESKRFSEGVSINQHGEFTAFYAGKPQGVASPIEQNRKHCQVLGDLLKSGAVGLPKRLGLTIPPALKSVILISKNSTIKRPKKTFPGVEQIIKIDQFLSHIGKQMAENTNPLHLAKVISSETLMNLGYEVAALHRPIQFNWAGRFGLDPAAALNPLAASAPSPSAVDACQADGCGKKVSAAVVKFCHDQHRKFGGMVYCMNCQRSRP